MDKILTENERCVLCGDKVEINDYDEYLCNQCYEDLEEQPCATSVMRSDTLV